MKRNCLEQLKALLRQAADRPAEPLVRGPSQWGSASRPALSTGVAARFCQSPPAEKSGRFPELVLKTAPRFLCDDRGFCHLASFTLISFACEGIACLAASSFAIGERIPAASPGGYTIV